MTSQADAYTFECSTRARNQQPVFTSKQWTYQIDQNNSSYASKQIIFDLSGFYNSERFINPQEMFFAIPVVSTLSAVPGEVVGTRDGLGAAPVIGWGDNNEEKKGDYGNANNGQVTDQFSMGFKSGYWNLIHSIQISVDGKDIIQLTPYINYLASFDAITSWSDSDVKKYGAIEGFIPDTATSWNLNDAGSASPYGFGVCNNTLPPVGQKQIYPYSVYGSNRLSYLNSPPMVNGTSPTEALNTVNEGLWQRMKTTNHLLFNDQSAYPPGFAANGPDQIWNPALGQNSVAPEQSFQDSLDNFMTAERMTLVAVPQADSLYNANVEDANSRKAFRQLFTTCIIKFKSFCNLFERMPLTRGLYVRITVNVNSGALVVGTNAPLTTINNGVDLASSSYAYYKGISQNTFSNTCPIMLAPLQTSALTTILDGSAVGTYPDNAGIQIYPGVACDAGTINRAGLVLSCSIYQPDPIHKQYSPGLAIQNHSLQNCRVYAPIIDLEPALVNSYLTHFKEQAIHFRDSLWFSQPGIGGGKSFNYQVGNGFVNLERLVIIPFYHDDTIAGTVGGVKIPFEPTSPWSSAPSTVAPYHDLQNFQVRISNINIFPRDISYSFENFLEEMGLCNAINGGLDVGLTSGLTGFLEWKNLYRYVVVDLSRRCAGDNTPKSVTILGQNKSSNTVDYHVFLQYRRHLTLDVETGRVQVSSN